MWFKQFYIPTGAPMDITTPYKRKPLRASVPGKIMNGKCIVI